METLVYTSCAVTSVLCAWLLLRFYYRTRYRLLLWSGLCFAGLAMSNLALVSDKLMFAQISFGSFRLLLALVALLPLLYGLIFEE